MAMHVPRAPGFASMMKEGAKHYSGMDEAVYRNIEACSELAKTVRSCYGPNGRNKMIINHLDKLFVTADAATILKELEVQHPAAKLLVMASQQQEQEAGDGTNLVLIFAGALLEQSEELLKMGVSTAEIVHGYKMACDKALELLETHVVGQIDDFSNADSVKRVMKAVAMSKQYGYEDILAELITKACMQVLPGSDWKRFNTDNVRVCKILGAGVLSSSVVSGMVFKRSIEGTVRKMSKCKVAVYSCPLDTLMTETKGTVLIKNADELLNYSKSEEDQMEQHIKDIVETGVNLIVTGGKVGELAQHYCNKFGIMVVRLTSKFDVRRLCQTVGAIALPKIVKPLPTDVGFCDECYVDEIGETAVVVFRQDKEDSGISTIVVRGATENIMDDIERAIDDCVNTFKALTKDARYVPGAGAVEIELANALESYADLQPGLEQYAIKKFALAFESIVKTLADNCGVKSQELLSKLRAAHKEGKKSEGFNIEDRSADTFDVTKHNIFDLYYVKYWAIKFATNAATTVLSVGQIIMSKPAGGGPKPKEQTGWDNDD